jgi:hypothetical protein
MYAGKTLTRRVWVAILYTDYRSRKWRRQTLDVLACKKCEMEAQNGKRKENVESGSTKWKMEGEFGKWKHEMKD